MFSVGIYSGSSNKCNPRFLQAAAGLGHALANSRFRAVYGGGSVGLMGKLAEGVLECDGEIIGVIPRFMHEREWVHLGLSELRVVETMHERKHMILELSDAVVALPGGCGTLDELFEAITWRRLSLFKGPVIILNIDGFYDGCLQQLDGSIKQGFLKEEDRNLWTEVRCPTDVVPKIREFVGQRTTKH